MHLSNTLHFLLCLAALATAFPNAFDSSTHNYPILEAREPKNESPPRQGSPPTRLWLPSPPSSDHGGSSSGRESTPPLENYDMELTCRNEACYRFCYCAQHPTRLLLVCWNAQRICQPACRCEFTGRESRDRMDDFFMRTTDPVRSVAGGAAAQSSPTQRPRS